MKLLILDPVGGASGDMILSSLIDLGCPVEFLEEILLQLRLPEVSKSPIIETEKKNCHGISTIHIKFRFDGKNIPQRSFREIRELLERSSIDENIKNRALGIFTVCAEAEGDVHGCALEDVHFHEIGATDSILDITAIAAALEWFGIETCCCRPVPLGKGTAKCQHGIIPVPAPATEKILQGMQVRFTEIESELTTPTGAAVIKFLCQGNALPADPVMINSGYGAGTKKIEGWPNMFRAMLCESESCGSDSIYIMEADIDDMNPEDWEGALARIFEAGALDVNLTPRTMKRGRPGTGVRAVVPYEKLEQVSSAFLYSTTTIGIRFYPVQRHVLKRREYSITVLGEPISVKESLLPDGTRRIKPEFRDLYNTAKKQNMTVKQIREEALKALPKNE